MNMHDQPAPPGPMWPFECGIDYAGSGGDRTAVSVLCRACGTIYVATLEADQKVVDIQLCRNTPGCGGRRGG